MITRTLAHGAFAFVATMLFSLPAQALIFRAYLASDGLDTNPCTLTAPCRLLPAALAAVADGGEIWMLDSANFNTATVSIAKNVTILAIPGAVGSVVGVAGPAIDVSAPSLRIALRNLVLVPLPGAGATIGLQLQGTSYVSIEHSVVAHFPNDAIFASGAGTLSVVGSIIRDNAGYAVDSQNGMRTQVSGSTMLNNGLGGLYAGADSNVTTSVSVSDSHLFGAAGVGNGINAKPTVIAGVARVTVSRCVLENFANALLAFPLNGNGTATIDVSGSTINDNGFSWQIVGTNASIRTLGNNHITNGATNGGLTPLAQQ